MSNSKPCTTKNRGFTLIELLTVMGILVLLAALTVPAYQSLTNSLALTRAANLCLDNLSQARQEALTKGDITEVRFYKANHPGSSGETYYRIIRLVRINIDDTGTITESDLIKPSLLPVGTAISEMATFSTLVTESPIEGESLLPGWGEDLFEYVGFRFARDGSTNLSPSATQNWFVTLVPEKDATASKQPDNFATVRIDPQTGRSQLYQP